MGGQRKRDAAPFPSRDQILDYIRSSDGQVGKRDIARAFRLDGSQKIALKAVLKSLESEGVLGRGRGRRFREPGTLPAVAVIEIKGPDTDGELIARPIEWDEPDPPPPIYMVPDKRSRAALAVGERVLARLRPIDGGAYEGHVIRRLTTPPTRALGIYFEAGDRGRIRPIDRRAREEFTVAREDAMEAANGELVWAEVRRGRPLGLRPARVVERLGPTMGPRSISLITIHDHDIPTQFSEQALGLAAAAGPVAPNGREDLRPLPLVTIDGSDARDFDDAVWAEPDGDPQNAGGWHLIVAIADVAWYVRLGDALDQTARERGNSVYFPDCVVPMLPEALSNGWCSLVAGEDRPCLAVHLWIDANGALLRHRFVRGLMRSAARLTYAQVQAARDGGADDVTAPLAGSVITPLYGAYQSLARIRKARGVLELDLAERRVIVAADGNVGGIERRERFDSHRLIEEFMITANVAAAESLERHKRACVYRVHDQPTLDKLEALREFLETLDLGFPRGRVVRAKDFNWLLAKVAGRAEAEMVNQVVLRSQAQAIYDPHNIGHFGLALRRYCHFTSPIRRYADLLIHRALIEALHLGEGGASDDAESLAPVAEHISTTERRAAAAERDAVDRFTSAYLADKVGAVFSGRINGVTRFGLFVTLDDTGADGLIPVSTLPDDWYVHDQRRHRLVGRDWGRSYALGDTVEVRLAEADPITGGLILGLMEGSEAGSDRRKSGFRSKPRSGGRRDGDGEAKAKQRKPGSRNSKPTVGGKKKRR